MRIPSLLGRRYATIASGKSLRSKGPPLTLEHVGNIVLAGKVKLVADMVSSFYRSHERLRYGGRLCGLRTVCWAITLNIPLRSSSDGAWQRSRRLIRPSMRCLILLGQSSRGIDTSMILVTSGI